MNTEEKDVGDATAATLAAAVAARRERGLRHLVVASPTGATAQAAAAAVIRAVPSHKLFELKVRAFVVKRYDL